MPDIKLTTQAKEKRVRNFDEVVLGLSKKQAVENARFLVQLKEAQQEIDCFFGTDAFAFLELLAKGNVNGAFQLLLDHNPLPSITGRFCQEPKQAVQVFNKAGDPLSVRSLERFVGDTADLSVIKPPKSKTEKHIAVIGSGPAGLTAAFYLRRYGHDVTVFESRAQLGGVLRYGYPEFRLPKQIVDRQIDLLISLGVNFKANYFIGQQHSLEDLCQNRYDAVCLATGAGIAKQLKEFSQPVAGVMYADQFLGLCNETDKPFEDHIPVGERVVVIGDGNTAFDSARVCVRLGAKVVLVSKGTMDDFKVKSFIVTHAKEEGVTFEVLTKTLECVADDKGVVTQVKCRRYDYADENNSGEWTLVELPDSDFYLDADTVIIAAGHEPNCLFARNDGKIKINSDKTVWTEGNSHKTAMKGVFACGNVLDGAGPVSSAIVSAKNAVKEINQWLNT